MGHYDTCREGYCGSCGQAEDENGVCLSKCHERARVVVKKPVERRVTIESSEDRNDPWITAVWVRDGKLNVEYQRASECMKHEFSEPTKVTDCMLFRGKIEPVDIRVGSYVLEKRK